MPGKLTSRVKNTRLGKVSADLGANANDILHSPQVKGDGGVLTKRVKPSGLGKFGDNGASDSDPRFNPVVKKG